MHRLIADILEYSKASNSDFKQSAVDLNQLIGQITRQIQQDQQYPKAQIFYSNMPVLMADHAQIHQLFQNLIENGLKYNDSEVPAVEIKSHLRHGKVHFSISDNGIGIDREYREKIFEMFRRLHNQESYPGTGIGLAICKKIVQHYRGNIRVMENMEKQQGTVFCIEFPQTMLKKSADKPNTVATFR